MYCHLNEAFVAGEPLSASLVTSGSKNPILIGLINWEIETVAMKMKLVHYFWYFCLFELRFLVIYQWFQSAFRILPSFAYETVKNQREETQKYNLQTGFFIFKFVKLMEI